MRRAERVQNVFARTGAGIEEAAGTQFFQSSAIIGETFALVVGTERAAAIGPFLPAKTEPAQVFDRGGNEFLFATGAVEVFVAQHQCATELLRALLRDPESPRVAQVQVAGGRGREATTVDSICGELFNHGCSLPERLSKINWFVFPFGGH